MTKKVYFNDLRSIRERSGLRVADLARAAHVDRSTISRVERHQGLTLHTALKILDALKDLNAIDTSVTLSDVVSDDDRTTDPGPRFS